MKKVLFSLLVLLSPGFLVSSVSAVEFELVRTKEIPGFFLLKVFPSQNTQALENPPVFVKNFSQEKISDYSPILEIIEDLGYEIVEKTVLKKYPPEKNIIILGEKIGEYPLFSIKTETPLKSFEDFQKQFMKPLYMKDITLSFGGNITDFFVEKTALTENTPLSIIGKFTHPRKTRLELTGKTTNGIQTFTANIPLDEISRANDPLANYLPELWENKAQKIPEKTDDPIPHFFPLLLFSFGILIVLLTIKTILKERQITKKHSLLENAPNSIKKSPQSQNIGIPFEIEINPSSNEKK